MNDNHDKQIEATETEQNTNTKCEIEQDEFKVVIRKLEMPVRPRGVLAE